MWSEDTFTLPTIPVTVPWRRGSLGQIRPHHHRDETWSTGLWHSFFASCVVTNILTELPLSWLVIAKSSRKILLVIMLPPVLPMPDPKRLTIGQSSNQLTYFTQHIGWRLNRLFNRRSGVSDVGKPSWFVTSRIWRVRCLWWWISTSPTKDLEVDLTLALMDSCIIGMTEMVWPKVFVVTVRITKINL
jgi:hypothetical protein